MQKSKQQSDKSPSLEVVTTKQGFTKRIGTTTYRVTVYFSETGKETMSDKIIRMIKNETAGKAAKM